jgi:hypothetical protein
MRRRWASVAVGLLGLAGQAIGKPLPDGGVTPQEMAEVLKAGGYPIEAVSSSATPVIDTSVNGIKFGIHFFECDPDKRCQSILFSASWHIAAVSEARMQEWNKTKRFGRAYLYDGVPVVEMDMDVHHGATTEALVSNLDRWKLVVKEFPVFFRR